MQKIFLLLFVTIFISGCHFGSPGDITEQEMLETAKPVCEDVDVKTKQQKIDPISFENLVGEYGEAVIKTNFGDIKIKFYNEDSPVTVNNFLNLSKMDFYNCIKFHRVIGNFMIQSGDPNSCDDDWSNDGMGGPGYKFQDEFNEHKLVRGSIAMANSGPNTNGSQFFIVTTQATPHLDGRHTNFGYVTEGMDVVDRIEAVQTNENDHPTTDVIIENVELIKK